MTTERMRSLGIGLALLAALMVFIGARADGNALPVRDNVAPQGQATTVSPIRWQRTALIASGQTEQALRFAVAVTEYVNRTFPEITVEVYTEILGDGGKVHWFVDYESLAQLDGVLQTLATDAMYSQMLADISGTFVAGHTHDTVYRNMR